MPISSRFQRQPGLVLPACIALVLLALPLKTQAQDSIPRRAVSLEWEEIEGTSAFELEFRKYLTGKKLKDSIFFKVKASNWSAKLVPGRYQLRIRSYDARGIAGEWGEPSIFVVQLPPAQLIEPTNGKNINSEEDNKEKIHFAWKPIVGATNYKLVVWDERGKVIAEEVTEGGEADLKLQVGEKYQWNVVGQLNEDWGDGALGRSVFALTGPALPVPQIEETHPNLVKELKWSEEPRAQGYEYTFERKIRRDWKKIGEAKSQKNTLRFTKALGSGDYRLQVRAINPYRKPSETAQRDFNVEYDARGPASIEEARTEMSVDDVKHTYALAQYIVAIMNYSGFNADRGYVHTGFNAVGGSGRLGLGHWFKDSDYGILGSAELSGFQVGPKSFQYSSMQADLGWKKKFAKVGQLRAWAGLQYRELPETQSDPADLANLTISNISSLGPHLSVAYLKGFTPKFGINLNANIFFSTFGVKTPTGASLIPTTSLMVGILGSMKLSDNLVGFAGYAYRDDRAAYKSSAIEAFDGGNNTVQIRGHYINLMLQWGY